MPFCPEGGRLPQAWRYREGSKRHAYLLHPEKSGDSPLKTCHTEGPFHPFPLQYLFLHRAPFPGQGGSIYPGKTGRGKAFQRVRGRDRDSGGY